MSNTVDTLKALQVSTLRALIQRFENADGNEQHSGLVLASRLTYELIKEIEAESNV